MYNEYKAIKAAELQAVQGMIHFSFDLWTSPNHLALMGIVAHYIDKYGQNQSVSDSCVSYSRASNIKNQGLIELLSQTLIAVRQLRGPHTGENQAEVIIKVLEDYKLDKHIGYFITDNALNNDTAIQFVLEHFFPYMPEKRRLARRLRCLGHVINLAAKAFLFGQEYDAFEKDIESVKEHSELLKELKLWRKRGPVGKLHNIVTYICRSP